MIRLLLVHNRYRQRAGEDRSFDAERDLLARDERVDLAEHVVDSRDADDHRALAKASVALGTTWSRRAAEDVARALETHRADVVHFHNTFPLLSPAVYAAGRKSGARVVRTVRNFRQFCANGLFFRDGHVCEDCVGRVPQWPGVVHRCYRDSAPASAAVVAMQTVHHVRKTWRKDVDAYVVPTRFLRDKLGSAGLVHDRIEVKPDVVFPPESVPAEGGRGHAVFVGRLTYEKGVGTLLGAWRGLPEIPLVIVGGGPEEARIRAEIEREGLGGRVTVTGEATHAVALDAIASARFVVIPSLSYETFGRTAVEAYAAGTPVLASRIGALEETVVDGRTGFLFDPGDEDALAAGAHRLWDEQPGGDVRAHYDEVYAPAVVHERLVSLYEDLLG